MEHQTRLGVSLLKGYCIQSVLYIYIVCLDQAFNKTGSVLKCKNYDRIMVDMPLNYPC